MAAMAAMVLGGAALNAAPALATEHQVQMLNKGTGGMMVFEPSFLKIAPGELIQTAKKLNPFPPTWYRFIEGRSEFHLRHYEAAAQLLERVGTSPNYWVHNWLAACYAKLGRMLEAKSEVAKALKLKETLTLKEIARMPFANADDLNHLLEALREAGMPERCDGSKAASAESAPGTSATSPAIQTRADVDPEPDNLAL
jgi:hypothetical protein